MSPGRLKWTSAPFPHASSDSTYDAVDVPLKILTQIGEVLGSGFVDLVIVYIYAAAQSNLTDIYIYTDDVLAFMLSPGDMNVRGFSDTTPPLFLPQFDEDGICVMMITKRWEFRHSFKMYALNLLGAQSVLVHIYPNLIR